MSKPGMMRAELIEWAQQLLRDHGFTYEQVGYMVLAYALVDSGEATDVHAIMGELGYGVVDEAVLRDTFFRT